MRIRLAKENLIGNRVYAAGDVADVHEHVGTHLIRLGHATATEAEPTEYRVADAPDVEAETGDALDQGNTSRKKRKI